MSISNVISQGFHILVVALSCRLNLDCAESPLVMLSSKTGPAALSSNLEAVYGSAITMSSGEMLTESFGPRAEVLRGLADPLDESLADAFVFE